jgi:hypothetical protein
MIQAGPPGKPCGRAPEVARIDPREDYPDHALSLPTGFIGRNGREIQWNVRLPAPSAMGRGRKTVPFGLLLPSPGGRHKIRCLNRLAAFYFRIPTLEGRALETLATYLDRRAKEIKDSLTHFLLNHSAIEPRKPYDEVWHMSPEGDRYYAELDKVGFKMQSYLSECYRQFCSVIDPLLENQPEDVLSKMSKSREVVTRTIEHRITFCESSRQALEMAMTAFEEQLTIVRNIIGESA